MPSKSKSQSRLFQAAAHGASFPAAKKIRAGMTMQQISEFTATPQKNLPNKVKKTKVSQPSRRMRTQEYQSSYGRIQPTLNTATSYGSRRSNF